MALTAQQKLDRLQGVGASEVLAALGKDPRCSPLKLYGRKLGELPEPNLDNEERVLFGNLLEPVIRTETARRLNTRIIQRHKTLYHREAPLLGHVDGWIPALRCGLEIKTADRFEAEDFGTEDSDQVPVRYYMQCAAYMAITEANEWRLAVLIGGNVLRMYRIARDPGIEQMIVEGVRRFWDHVTRLEPPDPTTPEDVRLRWPKDFGSTVLATDEIARSVTRLREMRADVAQLEAQCDCELVTVQKFMAENSELVDSAGNLLATWRTAKPSHRLDTKALIESDPRLCAQYMREYPGSRRFLLKEAR
jgi:predicted phage-related endonuclease